jgi:starch phosphorylase
MDLEAQLRNFAKNLWWSWHPAYIQLFRELDLETWRAVNHNPIALLDQLASKQIQARASDIALETRLTHAIHNLEHHLTGRGSWGARYAAPLYAKPVAYFTPEIGLHESLPIYSGGLGILAGDHLKAASDLGIPIVGVSLFYRKGYFRQRLDANGWQHAEEESNTPDQLPMERATDADGQPLTINLQQSGRRRPIHVAVWTLRLGRNRLVLLDTNVKGNTQKVCGLCDRLYGGGDETRIQQELVLGVGGLRALQAMDIEPGVLHLNEGHSAFATLELARSLMVRQARAFEEVQETAAAHTVFTTHTPVEAGHDRFDSKLVDRVLAPLRDQLGLSHDALMRLGRTEPDNGEEPLCMTTLALKMSRYRNAVSALHGRVTRAMWHPLWPERAEDQVPIGHITNGVHIPSWLAAPLGQLYRQYLGENWVHRLQEAQGWEAVEQIDEEELWEQHQLLKTNLIDYVRRCVRRQAQQRGEDPKQAVGTMQLDPNVLTLGFARRMAGYKRCDLLLGDPGRLEKLVTDPERPIQLIFSGKAHPKDEEGKHVIQRLFQATRDPQFNGRIVFLGDYQMNVGRHLVQGVDLWLNNPQRPLEASGTSGQKVVFNSGLNLSVLDGWWAEAYDGTCGFAIGRGDEHSDPREQENRDRAALFDVLEQQVIPLYYHRDEEGVPRAWIDRQKEALRSLTWRISAQRMVRDYTRMCYLPAAGAASRSAAIPT